MDVECEIKFEPEQREAGDELAFDPAERPSVVRGRPFAKGQSGNPAGRPARMHSTGTVAEYLIGRKTVPLTKKAVQLALAGDKTMLRLCLAHIAPLQKGASEWLGLPLAEDEDELRKLIEAVTIAAAKGAITPVQADALIRIVNTVLAMI